MFHLIQDPDDNSYLLLETENANTAYVYCTVENKCWLPLSTIPTTIRTHKTSADYVDESPENFRSWTVYAHHTKAGILAFIDNHPELLI